MNKEEISIFIKMNNEIEKFVKNQREVLNSYERDFILADYEEKFINTLRFNLDNLIYWKNKHLGLEELKNSDVDE